MWYKIVRLDVTARIKFISNFARKFQTIPLKLF